MFGIEEPGKAGEWRVCEVSNSSSSDAVGANPLTSDDNKIGHVQAAVLSLTSYSAK